MSTSPSESPKTASSRSAAEQRASARIGALLFRSRSWLPVPFLLLALLVPAHPTSTSWLLGFALIIPGELIRLSGVAAAGTVTRRRSRDVQRLVTYGIFRWVRNPLYVGNFLIWMGFVLISGVPWLVPLAIVVFAIEYYFIVAYEEGVLESIFGPEYLAYKRTTPRWIPATPKQSEPGPHDWKEALTSETSTFLQYLALVAVFAAKQWWLSR
ncbi:MAG TPA: isoprenylcysteine carboxylmethyltransferase family protein [Gemmatimonadaceae bacterium]|jgi:protein-S-isoprenylcysteine O-methyltransferase Ste14|nr:isoprenylcysteine carboxylmethyltransferase family protein [Gemmatimonadaceae bacterium]